MKKIEFSSKLKSNLLFWGILLLLLYFFYFNQIGVGALSKINGAFLPEPEVILQKSTLIDREWELEDLDGNLVTISDIKQPIFVSLWATWCKPCISEMPYLAELITKHPDIRFLLVSNESKKKLINFKFENNWNLPFYLPKNGIPNSFRSEVLPCAFVINKQKEIVFKLEGAHKWQGASINQLLSKLTLEE